MNRTTLNEKHRAVLGRWWVTMRDTGGRPPQQMLDELADLAEAHAADGAKVDQLAEAAKGPEIVPVQPHKTPTAATAARRRQPARRSTK